jgi:P-type Cu+ transporter
MAMSSVTVVGNSLLLGRYKPKFGVRKSTKKEEVIYSDKDLKQVYLPSTTTSTRTTTTATTTEG